MIPLTKGAIGPRGNHDWNLLPKSTKFKRCLDHFHTFSLNFVQANQTPLPIYHSHLHMRWYGAPTRSTITLTPPLSFFIFIQSSLSLVNSSLQLHCTRFMSATSTAFWFLVFLYTSLVSCLFSRSNKMRDSLFTFLILPFTSLMNC